MLVFENNSWGCNDMKGLYYATFSNSISFPCIYIFPCTQWLVYFFVTHHLSFWEILEMSCKAIFNEDLEFIEDMKRRTLIVFFHIQKIIIDNHCNCFIDLLYILQKKIKFSFLLPIEFFNEVEDVVSMKDSCENEF